MAGPLRRVASAVVLALAVASPARLLAAQPMSTVTGAVEDPTRTGVAGAQVVLIASGGSVVDAITCDASGGFVFTGVPAGSYRVSVHAVGFAAFASSPFTLSGDRPFSVPTIVLAVDGGSSSVVVRPTKAIAAEQIKAQEKQRLFGFLPNFYVSYVADAAPLTSGQKFSLAAHETFDWTAFVGASVAAGVSQTSSTQSAFGTGAAGYAKRWAAHFVDDRSGDLLSHYVFASLFHEDPRYFYQGTGTTRSRLAHALTSALVARSDRGAPMPNYAYLLANVSAAALSNLYYPHAERGAGLILANAAIGFGGRASVAVMQEFVWKRLTRNVSAADGKSARR